MAADARNIDILLITESTIDGTFPKSQFNFNGYIVPHRHNPYTNDGFILVYVCDGIRSCIIECENLPRTFF